MAVTVVGFVNGNVGWAWPSGTAAGDLALVMGVAGAGLMTGLTGFTALPNHEGVLSGSSTCAAWKLLTSGDVGSPPPQPVLSNGFALMAVFRGLVSVVEGSVGPSTGGAGSEIPGFTKDVNSAAVFVFQADRDPAAASGVFYPSGFTAIGEATGTYFMTKISYLDSASYGGENINAPLPAIQYNGIGIAYDLIGDVPPTPEINASFVGPMGAFDAAAKLVARIESASFVGPMGYADSLLVSLSGDPTEVYIRQGSGRVVLESTPVAYSDGEPTYSALQAGFRGPMGRFDARLTLHPEIEADFVGPFGQFAANLIEGPIINAAFVGPFGYTLADLQVEMPLTIMAGFVGVGPSNAFNAELIVWQIEAGFVGPRPQFDAELEFFAIDAGFVGPMGRFLAEVLSADGLYGRFVGPRPQFDASLEAKEDLTADFVGPFGYFSAQLGEDNRTLEAAFVGPFGHFDADLYTPNVIIATFVGPIGYAGARLDVVEELNAAFVGPFGHMDALLARGPRLDAFFRGPRPNFNAELEKAAGAGETLQLLLIQP